MLLSSNLLSFWCQPQTDPKIPVLAHKLLYITYLYICRIYWIIDLMKKMERWLWTSTTNTRHSYLLFQISYATAYVESQLEASTELVHYKPTRYSSVSKMFWEQKYPTILSTMLLLFFVYKIALSSISRKELSPGRFELQYHFLYCRMVGNIILAILLDASHME